MKDARFSFINKNIPSDTLHTEVKNKTNFYSFIPAVPFIYSFLIYFSKTVLAGILIN